VRTALCQAIIEEQGLRQRYIFWAVSGKIPDDYAEPTGVMMCDASTVYTQLSCVELAAQGFASGNIHYFLSSSSTLDMSFVQLILFLMAYISLPPIHASTSPDAKPSVAFVAV
jgi:hypothetical protein